jgi:hypothetical protein
VVKQNAPKPWAIDSDLAPLEAGTGGLILRRDREP